MMSALNQDINNLALGIHCSPQIGSLSLDSHHYFIEMPFITGLWTMLANLGGVIMSKVFSPITNGFIAYLNTPIEHHFLDITIAESKGVIKPNAVVDNLNGKSMVFVAKAHVLCLIRCWQTIPHTLTRECLHKQRICF